MAAVIKTIDSLMINLLFKSNSPFSKEKLIEQLKDAGFDEAAATFPPLLEVGGGTIAKRKGVKINYVPESGVIGVLGTDIVQATSNFEKLLEILNRELPVEDTLKLCEMIFTARIESGKIPKEAINAFVGAGKLKPFKDVFGEETTISSIRLFPKDGLGTKDDIEWFDVVVEPSVLLPKLYHVRVVYRSANLNKVTGFAGALEKKVLKIIELIETGG